MNTTPSQPRKRAVGRPKRLDLGSLLDAVLHFGLDTFTMAQIANHLGVSEGTLYNYVRSREELRGRTAARLLDSIDTVVDSSDDWINYLVEVNRQLRNLAVENVGLSSYYLHGPYRPQTIDLFDRIVSGVVQRLPHSNIDLAFVLASHASTTTLSFFSGIDVDERIFRRVLRSTLPALNEALDGAAPAGVSWAHVVQVARQ